LKLTFGGSLKNKFAMYKDKHECLLVDSAPTNNNNIMSRSLIQQLLQIGCV